MAFNAKEATFSWNFGDAATTTYDVTFGSGFGTPEFFIVTCSGTVSSTDTVAATRPIALGIGFGVSSTNRRSMLYVVEDALATSGYTIVHRTDAIVATNTGLLDVAAEAGWPTDGMRFVVDVQQISFWGNMRITVLAFSGTDITAANTFTFQEHTSAATQNVAHGLGSTPTGALFCSVGYGTAPNATVQTQGSICLGATDGTNMGVLWLGGDDANTTIDSKGYCKTGELITMAPEPPTTLNARVDGISFDATNVNLTWAERTATRYCFGLAWTGGAFKASSVTTATNTTGFNGPTNGFTAKAAMFVSAMRPASTADTPTDHGQFSIGFASSTSSRICHAGVDKDNVGTSEVAVAVETDEVYINIASTAVSAAGPISVSALMDVTSTASDPWTLVMDTAEPTSAMLVLVWSWGEDTTTQSVTAGAGVMTFSAPAIAGLTTVVAPLVGTPLITLTAPTATRTAAMAQTAGTPVVTFAAGATTRAMSATQIAGAPVLSFSAPAANRTAAMSQTAGTPVIVFSAPHAEPAGAAGQTVTVGTPVLTFSAPTTTRTTAHALTAGTPRITFTAGAAARLASSIVQVGAAPTITMTAGVVTRSIGAVLRAVAAPVITFSAPHASVFVEGGPGEGDQFVRGIRERGRQRAR
jgi:hypothetical protein